MINLLHSNRMRHAFSLFLAFVIAIIVNHYYALSGLYLVPLSALLVMQTSIGNVLYQGVMRLLGILFFITILSVLLGTTAFLFFYVHDAVLGAVIGILANLFIFARQADREFRNRVIPVLEAYRRYLQMIEQQLFQNELEEVVTSTIAMERAMLDLPSWVFQRGFDSGLQKGHQYFLIKVEEVGDILFSMHHLARYPFHHDVLAAIRDPFQLCVSHLEQHFVAIVTVMTLKKLERPLDDMVDALERLEQAFQAMVPPHIALTEFSLDYSYLSELILLINELRNALLRLMQALR